MITHKQLWFVFYIAIWERTSFIAEWFNLLNGPFGTTYQFHSLNGVCFFFRTLLTENEIIFGLHKKTGWYSLGLAVRLSSLLQTRRHTHGFTLHIIPLVWVIKVETRNSETKKNKRVLRWLTFLCAVIWKVISFFCCTHDSTQLKLSVLDRRANRIGD